MPRMYFEDFVEGSVTSYGPRTVTREEIVAFAAEFDPQPMHLDEEAAKRSMLGGLAASGWHTSIIMMRMMADSFLLDSSSMGSPGIDENRWVRPVRPGDQLTYRRSILGKRASKSRPGVGLVQFRHELLNQAGEAVLECTNTIMFGTREKS